MIKSAHCSGNSWGQYGDAFAWKWKKLMTGDYKYSPGDPKWGFFKLFWNDLAISNSVLEKCNTVVIEVLCFMLSQ